MTFSAWFHFQPTVSHAHGFADLVIDALVRGVIYQMVRAVFQGQSLLVVLGLGLGLILIAWALFGLRRR